MKPRTPGDDIRGVGPYHSRVFPENERELDRMHQEHGEPAAWMDNEPAFRPEHFGPLLDFLHSMTVIGDRARRIFFARLEGLTWAQIGLSLLRGATPQAAENEFRDILAAHPMLARAFPERKTKGKT